MRILLVVLVATLVSSCLAVAPSAFAGQSGSEEGALGAANPAAVYCRELGYDVEIVKTDAGEECICILPNGERCNAWDFFRGKCWQEYSYCALNGHRTEARIIDHGSYVEECAVCVAEDGTELGKVAELMNIEEKSITGTGLPIPAGTIRKNESSGKKERQLPASFDWRALGGCSSIKNQGSCGSCWAFGTVAALECNILIHDSVEVDLSEQWLVSCNQDNWGCGGGDFAHDYHQWKTDICNGTGAVLEEHFPYTATDEDCNCPYPHDYFLLDWAYIGNAYSVPPVDDIKQAIMDWGPVSVAVSADGWGGYSGGVYTACPGTAINHLVALVGWDDNLGPGGCWFLKNSWGLSWGEAGYMKIPYDCNGVGYGASYVDYMCKVDAVLKDDGSGTHATIQDAINATPANCVAFIDLDDGTYTGVGNRDLTITGRRVVVRSLNGDAELCTIDCEGLSRFATVDGGGILDLRDVTIANGAAPGGARNGDNGGTLCCQGANLALLDCTITGSDADGDGGAIYCDSSDVTIVSCTIETSSSGGSGGGICLGADCDATLSASTVNGNTAFVSGGGIAVPDSGDVEIIDCLIAGNSTDSTSADGRGGGVFYSSVSGLTSCAIVGNRSSGAGGGIYLSLGAGLEFNTLELTIADNYSESTGGGAHLDGACTVGIHEAIIWGNCADGLGDEIYQGAGSPSLEIGCSDVDSTGMDGSGTVNWLWQNFSAIPGFCDPKGCASAPTAEGDYSIKDNSPCADACGVIGALGVGCSPGIVTVCPGGGGDYTMIQDAVDAAPWYDIIELCDATYTGVGNRDIDPGGKVLTIRSQSGNAPACVIDCEGQARAFHFHTGEDSRVAVQDLTIANGQAGDGGGIYCDGASPVISGCILRECSATGTGAAILCSNSSLSIQNCTLSKNSAVSGAGIHCASSSPTVENTIVAFSTSGEAVSCDTLSAPVFSCCDVFGNAGGDWVGCIAGLSGADGNFSADPAFCDTASSDYSLDITSPCRNPLGCGQVGALGVGCWRAWVWHVPGDVPTIQAALDSAVAGDTVVVACGTYSEYGLSLTEGVTLRSETESPDCVTVDGGDVGRILSCYTADSTTSIVGITFTGGKALGPFWPYNAGGAMYFENASPNVSKCIFDGNASEWGGAVACRYESPRIVSCTFINNSATGTGAGIYSYYSDLRLERSMVVFSTQGCGVDGHEGSAAISCVDIYGNAGGDWVNWVAGLDSTGGNLSADPQFCEPYTGHIAAFSLCAPANSPAGCDLIGALDVGCELTPVAGTGDALPSALYLGPAVPNPFNPVTEIAYGIPAAEGHPRVRMNVYNALGRRVATLVDENQSPGVHRVVWDGTDHKGVPAASGVYFYRITWNGKSETKRMVLLK